MKSLSPASSKINGGKNSEEKLQNISKEIVKHSEKFMNPSAYVSISQSHRWHFFVCHFSIWLGEKMRVYLRQSRERERENVIRTKRN
jgi:hypothetical protein